MTLKTPCKHGRYEKHLYNSMGPHQVKTCPGGTLLPEDTLVIVKEDGRWPESARDALKDILWHGHGYTFNTILDALAAAQRGDG